MAFCTLDTSMLIDGCKYLIQMRRDNVGCFWKFDVLNEDETFFYVYNSNTYHTDFESASYVVEAAARKLGE